MNYILPGLLFAGLVVHLVGWRLSRRQHSARSQLFGMRTRSSLASDSAWAAAQRAGWRIRALLIPVYAFGIAAMVLASRSDEAPDRDFPLIVVIGAASVVISTISIIAADRAAQAAS